LSENPLLLERLAMDANVRTLKKKLQCTADHLQLKRISEGKLLNKNNLQQQLNRHGEWEPNV
jgi:hypothetical protein